MNKINSKPYLNIQYVLFDHDYRIQIRLHVLGHIRYIQIIILDFLSVWGYKLIQITSPTSYIIFNLYPIKDIIYIYIYVY